MSIPLHDSHLSTSLLFPLFQSSLSSLNLPHSLSLSLLSECSSVYTCHPVQISIVDCTRARTIHAPIVRILDLGPSQAPSERTHRTAKFRSDGPWTVLQGMPVHLWEHTAHKIAYTDTALTHTYLPSYTPISPHIQALLLLMIGFVAPRSTNLSRINPRSPTTPLHYSQYNVCC